MRGGEQVGSANKPGARVGAGARPAVSSMPKVRHLMINDELTTYHRNVQARQAPAASRAAPRPAGGAVARATNGSGSAAAQAQIEDLNNQMVELKLTVEGLEKERDFYFGKDLLSV